MHKPPVQFFHLPLSKLSSGGLGQQTVLPTEHVRWLVSCRLDIPEQHRESSLKYQTRCVAAFSGAYSFAVASVEGRVAMEILDPSPEAQEKKYAFKVGRQG